MNKIDQFQSVVYAGDFDIICITETWLTDAVSSSELLSNYCVYRQDRGSRGGGVLIAVKISIASRLFCIGDSFEMVTVFLETRPRLLLSCLYIPPNCSTEYQNLVLQFLATFENDLNSFVVGDFNLSDIDWETQHATSSFSQEICKCFCLHNFVQLVDSPTHQSGSILDLVLTNVQSRATDIIVSSNLPLFSDHFPIIVGILLSPVNSVSSVKPKLNFFQCDFVAFSDHLTDLLSVYDLFSFDRLEISWLALKNAITQCISLFVPSSTVSSDNLPRWFNASVRHQHNKVRTLRKRVKTHSSLSQKLESMENELQKLVLSAKESYLTDLTVSFKSDPHKLYSYLKQMTDDGSGPSVLCHNGRLIYDPAVKATLFNEYFHSVFTSSDFCLPFLIPSQLLLFHVFLSCLLILVKSILLLSSLTSLRPWDVMIFIHLSLSIVLIFSLIQLLVYLTGLLNTLFFLLNGKFTKYIRYIKVGIKV